MPKSWVKNVNNQRITGRIISVYTSTKKLTLKIKLIIWAKDQLNNLLFQPFSNIISTTINLIFNLLNKTFTHNPQHLLIRLIKKI